MAIRIDFTGRDYDTNLQILKEFISSRAPESWNSFFESDLSKVILDVISYDHAMLSYIQDAQVLEGFIDTLRLRESLTHFTNLTGYNIRRNSAATIEVYAQAINPPLSGYYFIKGGTPISSTNGIMWEVAEDTTISTNAFTPAKVVNRFGDIKATVFASTGTSHEVSGLIKIEQGSSLAVLVDYEGNRLPSEYGFSSNVGNGHILCLDNIFDPSNSTISTASFTSAPDVTRNEFAVTSIGKFSYDVYDRSVLFLDRPWDGVANFIGKWHIENRSVPLIQGETKSETYVAPSSESDRKNWTIQATSYPVISSNTEKFIVSGLSSLTSNGGQLSGVTVIVDGVVWNETSSLFFNVYDDNVYEVSFDQDDRVTIKFGDGIFGKMIPESSTVDITYRVGGGKEGNLPQNSFNYSLQLFESATGDPNTQSTSSTSVLLSNPYTVGLGGQDRESLEQAKKNIVQFIRTNDRAVTVDDYAYLASNFTSSEAGRVKLAKGVLYKNTVPREQNIIWIYVWVEGLNGQLVPPTLRLKSYLLEYMNMRKLISDEVVIVDGITTNVPIRFFYKYSPDTSESVVSEKVYSAINEKFKKLLPGGTMHVSTLYEAVESVSEVDYVIFDFPVTDFKPSSENEILINTLQTPKSTSLITDCSIGQTSVVVDDSSIFDIGGVISIFQRGKEPTSAIVEGISDSVVTLRPETPLKNSYTANDAEVLNSDIDAIGWQLDLPVDLFVSYAPTSGTSAQNITTNIVKKLKEYFSFKLMPSQILLKSQVENIVASVNGVGGFRVNIGSVDSVAEVVSPSIKERVILRNLIINGKSF